MSFSGFFAVFRGLSGCRRFPRGNLFFDWRSRLLARGCRFGGRPAVSGFDQPFSCGFVLACIHDHFDAGSSRITQRSDFGGTDDTAFLTGSGPAIWYVYLQDRALADGIAADTVPGLQLGDTDAVAFGDRGQSDRFSDRYANQTGGRSLSQASFAFSTSSGAMSLL